MYNKAEITDKTVTKQAFIEAFCLLYSQKPIEKITVQEITRKAGYNRSTFYQYFLDINDLLNDVENDLLDFICEEREKAGTGNNSFISDLVNMYETKALSINALLGDYGNNHFLEQMKAKLKFNIPELDLPDDNILKPYLIEYHLSTTLSLFRLWLRREKDLPAEEFLSLIANLYNDGISSIDVINQQKKRK